MIAALEASGFAALYLNRKAFDDRGDSVLQKIAGLGYKRSIESRVGEQIAVHLRPQPRPRPPNSQRLTIGRGWKIRPSDGAPWAYDHGALSYYNPYPTAITVDLQLTLTSRLYRRLALDLDGKRLRDIDVPGRTTRVVVPGVALPRGVHCFHVRSRESDDERGDATNEARAFGLTEANVQPVSIAGLR
jgi:hypothetical protein